MEKRSNRRSFLKALTLSGAALSSTSVATAGEAKKIVIPRRKLGQTGAETSILGLGLGSRFWTPFGEDPEGANEILLTALSYGINYWDTARIYGNSEELIGPTVEQVRDKIFLVSKSSSRDYDGYMRDLETSLKLLHTDHLDLYHMHMMDPEKDTDLSVIEKGAAKAAIKAKEEGIIKNYGMTGHKGPDIFIEGYKRWGADVVMCPFPADRPLEGAYENKLLPFAKENNFGVIAMKTNRHARNTDWPAPQLIRYAMSLPGITTAIVGLDSMAHLKENAEMAANFTPMKTDEMAAFSHKVKTDLAHFGDAPWENPAYKDCSSNPLWA